MRANKAIFENSKHIGRSENWHSRFSLVEKAWTSGHWFSKGLKKVLTPGNHVSVDEQSIGFRERYVHAMQLAGKAAEVGFKLYSIYQENYLIDFLFTS
jgi:hypothetical protein